MDKVNLNQKLSLFDDLWSPKIVARLNDYDIRSPKRAPLAAQEALT